MNKSGSDTLPSKSENVQVQRPKSHVLQGLDWGKSFYYTHEADAFIEALETERADLWRKNRDLLGSHDVKAAAIGDTLDELRDTKRALELAAKFRILAVNPNCPTDGVKQSHIDEDVALFLDKARKERTKV